MEMLERRSLYPRIQMTGIADAVCARIVATAVKYIQVHLMHMAKVNARDAPKMAGFFDGYKLNALMMGVIDRIATQVLDDEAEIAAYEMFLGVL